MGVPTVGPYVRNTRKSRSHLPINTISRTLQASKTPSKQPPDTDSTGTHIPCQKPVTKEETVKTVICRLAQNVQAGKGHGRHELMSLLMPEVHRHRCLISSPRGFFHLPVSSALGSKSTCLRSPENAVKQWKNANFETSIDEIWNPLAQQHVRNLTTPSSKEPNWQQIHFYTVIIEQCIRSASPQLRASTDAVMYSSATSIGPIILTTVIVQHTPTP